MVRSAGDDVRAAEATAESSASRLALVGGEHRRVGWRAGCERERRHVLEHAGGDVGDVVEPQAVELDAGFLLQTDDHRVAQRASLGKCRYTVRSFTPAALRRRGR